MKTELDLGYALEIYEKGNYGTVKQKHFENMLDLVTFTNKKARTPNIDYIVEVINKTSYTTLYNGCIYIFNIKVNEILIQGNYSINN